MDGNGQQHILLVSACEATRDVCEQLLKRDGFAPVRAADDDEAILRSRSNPPQVLIKHVRAGSTGEATRALREHPATADIPVILLVDPSDGENPAEPPDSGADEFVFTPIRPAEFRLRVRSMVRLREACLESERAQASLQPRTELLAQLNQFSEQVLADNSADAVCRSIVLTAAQLTQSDRVSLLLPESRGRFLQIAHAVGIDEEEWQGWAVPLDSPIAGKAFTSGQEIIVDPDDDHPGGDGTYESDSFASVPLLCTPLRGEGGPIGVLNVTEKRNGRHYQPEEVQVLRQFAQTAALALNNVLTRKKLDQARDSIIFSMAKLSEYRHQETGKHLERVRELSILLAREVGRHPRFRDVIDETFISDLGRSAPLHDIGKVAIPDHILLKRGRFTEDEFRLMKNHTRIGAETLRNVIATGHEAGFIQMAMEIARYHHERYDGTGYPDGLAGEQIPLSARIVCLADAYDAIRMEREYKPARTHEEATREILQASGTQFDPLLVQAYCALQDAFRSTYERYAETPTSVDVDRHEPVLSAAEG